MLRLDIYSHGAGYRVRMHSHSGERDAECESDCEEYSVQRCYPERHASAAESRALVVAGVADALMSRGLGHQEFLRLLGRELPLF